MGFLSILKRNRQEYNQIPEMSIQPDFEMKYKSLLEDIGLLVKDLKREFEKHSYYLALNKLLYSGGIEKAEIFIDYHAGRVIELERILTRLLRILGESPKLEEIVKEQRQRALEDIQSTDNILSLLDYQDEEVEKIRGKLAGKKKNEEKKE
ncbi:hypothetical protein [Methanocaldococcus fervens]|uniref:Uncharacterized protein n=1 Tax=Methanocaldococcus fervens (strain DSM 4213 / JCM 15782 / AG86) TaxID=573064 RepID=C7P9R4_METFA|nr:hypothetical protein [Methanocaldococcus fervens]ACV25421.1 hypothetical protein Mefer_1618 [Methanocaldococcus fervens AG86]